MSRLKELIQELCPNGVEYKAFLDVCTYDRGITYSKSQEATLLDVNAVGVLRANNITLSTNTLNFDDVKRVKSDVKIKKSQWLYANDILICAGSGSKSHIGKVAYVTEDLCFTFGGFMAVIRCKECLNSRYLFYILTSNMFSVYLEKELNSSTINNLNTTAMAKFRFPVPPMEVQCEIVCILDNFTKCTAELTAKLTAELTSRKKQYEFYRDKLLTFDVYGGATNEVLWKTLGEVCDVIAGGTPSKKNDDYWNCGTIRWLGSTVCQNQKTVDNVTDYITEEGLSSSSAKMMKKETTLIALVGATIGKVAFLPFEAAINQNIAGIYPKDINILEPSYVYYICTTLYPKFLALTQGSKLAMANLSFVRGLQIPIPPINLQKKIVYVLDNFDSICSDLKIALPAEMEARKKQYEYYRDALLTYVASGETIVQTDRQTDRQTDSN